MADGKKDLEALVERSRAGDREALEDLVRAIQDRLYRLALRMLGDAAEAEDATQEILVKVITDLGSFRGRSSFSTWSYRVAINHLLQMKRRGLEKLALSFDQMAQMIDRAAAAPDYGEGQPFAQVLATELRLKCTQGMLVCLDREHRLAYILGEVLELSGEEGAEALDIEPAAFRKRLSRARADLGEFLGGRCGLYDAAAPCRCSKQIGPALRAGLFDPSRIDLATHPVSGGRPPPALEEMVGIMDAGRVFRGAPDYAAPDSFVKALREMIHAPRHA